MRRFTIMAVALGVVLACQVGAMASISLVYEDPAHPNYGQSYIGPVKLKIVNFDNGAVYTALNPGQAYGYSGLPGGESVGVAALDALAQNLPLGAKPTGPFPGNEDSWGIGRLVEIDDLGGNALWTPGVKGSEITALFYGEQDFYVKQDIAGIGGVQHIDGVGLYIDFWQHSPSIWNASSNLPSATGRTGNTTFTGVTSGTLVLSARSVSGFLDSPGVNGGAASEFESSFNPSTLKGTGDSYLDIIGGTDQALLDSNTIWTPASLANKVLMTDLWVHWTTDPNPDPLYWGGRIEPVL